jgi:hypothetical protein
MASLHGRELTSIRTGLSCLGGYSAPSPTSRREHGRDSGGDPQRGPERRATLTTAVAAGLVVRCSEAKTESVLPATSLPQTLVTQAPSTLLGGGQVERGQRRCRHRGRAAVHPQTVGGPPPHPYSGPLGGQRAFSQPFPVPFPPAFDRCRPPPLVTLYGKGPELLDNVHDEEEKVMHDEWKD